MVRRLYRLHQERTMLSPCKEPGNPSLTPDGPQTRLIVCEPPCRMLRAAHCLHFSLLDIAHARCAPLHACLPTVLYRCTCTSFTPQRHHDSLSIFRRKNTIHAPPSRPPARSRRTRRRDLMPVSLTHRLHVLSSGHLHPRRHASSSCHSAQHAHQHASSLAPLLSVLLVDVLYYHPTLCRPRPRTTRG